MRIGWSTVGIIIVVLAVVCVAAWLWWSDCNLPRDSDVLFARFEGRFSNSADRYYLGIMAKHADDLCDWVEVFKGAKKIGDQARRIQAADSLAAIAADFDDAYSGWKVVSSDGGLYDQRLTLERKMINWARSFGELDCTRQAVHSYETQDSLLWRMLAVSDGSESNLDCILSAAPWYTEIGRAALDSLLCHCPDSQTALRLYNDYPKLRNEIEQAIRLAKNPDWVKIAYGAERGTPLYRLAGDRVVYGHNLKYLIQRYEEALDDKDLRRRLFRQVLAQAKTEDDWYSVAEGVYPTSTLHAVAAARLSAL